MRVPLKFGAETLPQFTCLRVCITVRDRAGNHATGWGETPLSVPWGWPSSLSYDTRLASMTQFAARCRNAWSDFDACGHPMELGNDFLTGSLPSLLAEHNASEQQASVGEPMPYLAALICASAFDIAIHDAFGQLCRIDTYRTYNAQFMNRDLAHYLESDDPE